jgi:L-ribulose-5-phosphate 3-epimerase
MGKAKLGLMAGIGKDTDLVASFQHIQSFGIPTCQLHCSSEYVDDLFAPSKVNAAVAETGMEISAITCGFEGQAYDNAEGPATLGLVPPDLRAVRVPLMKHFSDVIRDVGIRDIVCHIGFIPDDENDPVYVSFLQTMEEVCSHFEANGQNCLVETGCELASTLRRTILDLHADNFFVNFDSANVILYGKSNPLDCVDLFGEWIRGCHMKDGVWPNRDETLGHETALGEGQVDFPVLVRRMKEKGFGGPYTIEREVSGPEQDKGIRQAIDLLSPLI